MKKKKKVRIAFKDGAQEMRGKELMEYEGNI
jgi:hypothetical protein